MRAYIPPSFVFGPVPSRRLGQSLGVNHVFIKTCTYDCVYCQVGRTNRPAAVRKKFFPPEKIIKSVTERVEELKAKGQPVDFISLVPDGEPTLDIHLEALISGLKKTGIPVAVITNATMLGLPEVRKALLSANLVSVKVDTVIEDQWRRINRPVADISFTAMMAGIKTFSDNFSGSLISESMLIKIHNDDAPSLERLADYLSTLALEKAYIAIPTRPPSEPWAMAPSEDSLIRAFQIFSNYGLDTEVLTGYSEVDYYDQGDVIENILAITSVHPMREKEILRLLRKEDLSLQVINELVANKTLTKVYHEGQNFYVRTLKESVST